VAAAPGGLNDCIANVCGNLKTEASHAASSDYESDIKINLEQVLNDLSYAAGSIDGA
jgi:hypothetical protein